MRESYNNRDKLFPDNHASQRTREGGSYAENELFEEERKEDREAAKDGEHGQGEALGGAQAEHQIPHVYQRQGKDLTSHRPAQGEVHQAWRSERRGEEG